MLAQARRSQWLTLIFSSVSLIAMLALSGCASDGAQQDDDESWRTASQRVGERRLLHGNEKKQAAAKATADQAAADQASGGEATADTAEMPEGVIRLDPDGPGDRSAFQRTGSEIPAPEKVYDPQPQYNEEARKARIQGSVIFDLYIDEEGDVQGADLVKDMPMGLTLEAYKAVRTWRFKPVVVDGEPIKVVYQVTINFRLQ